MQILERFGLDPRETLAWIKGVAGPTETPKILNDKGWSVVLHFGSVVLKVTAAGAFPDGARMFDLVNRAAPGLVPDLLAWRIDDQGRQEMLFRPFDGVSVESLTLAERPAALVEMARTIARIQAETQSPPNVPASNVPAMLDELIEGAVNRCRLDFPDRWSEECSRHEIPESLAEKLIPWRSAVADWAAELEDGGWSRSIDHVDLLPHNANRLPNGEILIYDWEQATLGVPFFSIDILLAYAQCLDEGHNGLELRAERPTETQAKLRVAYLSELPGPLDLALRLSPIRYCWAEWRQAEASGVPHYGVDDVAWWLGRALRRWDLR